MDSRSLRQLLVVQNIIKNKFRTWYEAFPGFGKTKIAIDLMKYILEKKPTATFAVIVPSIPLKVQWSGILEENGITGWEVHVINGVTIKETPITADVTFMDEAHTMINGQIFSKIFELCTSGFVIPFSGTFKPEHREFLNSLMPMADNVTFEEGKRNGWIAETKEFNLFITLSPEKQLEYDAIHEMFEEYYAHFNQNFNLAQSCRNFHGAMSYVQMANITHFDEEKNRWLTPNELAYDYSKKANIWGKAMAKRSNFINLSSEKTDAVVQIISSIKRKYVTFGLLNETADRLTKALPECKSYHSELETLYFPKALLYEYGMAKSPNGNPVKVSGNRLKKIAIYELTLDIIRGINSTKALDLGLDVPGLSMAVSYCRNSGQERQNQRGARVTRVEGDKVSLLINVILKNTKDESWAKSTQWGKRGIINVYSIEELLSKVND